YTPTSSLTVDDECKNTIWWPTNVCGTAQMVCGNYRQARPVTENAAQSGAWPPTSAPLSSLLTVAVDTGQHGFTPLDATDSCAAGAPNSCSPGTIHHEYDCSTPMREKGTSNKRGYWEVYTTTVPGDGNPVHIERTAMTKGATSVSDTTGLEKE